MCQYSKLSSLLIIVWKYNILIVSIYVASLQGPGCHKKKKIEIFVDLNRAGHDKSVLEN